MWSKSHSRRMTPCSLIILSLAPCESPWILISSIYPYSYETTSQRTQKSNSLFIISYSDMSLYLHIHMSLRRNAHRNLTRSLFLTPIFH